MSFQDRQRRQSEHGSPVIPAIPAIRTKEGFKSKRYGVAIVGWTGSPLAILVNADGSLESAGLHDLKIWDPDILAAVADAHARLAEGDGEGR